MRRIVGVFCLFAGALSAHAGAPARARADSGAPLLAPQAVWAWGANRSGQLGLPAQNTHIPNQLYGIDGVVALSGGVIHTLALTSDGKVWAWGSNEHGQLGINAVDSSLAPRRVAGLSGVSAIAAGGSFSLAFRASDAKLWGWGSNEYGQLLLPGPLATVAVPTELAAPAGLVAIRAGGEHVLGLDRDGKLWAWGGNFYGQLGDATSVDSPSPVLVSLGGPVSAFAAGLHHNIAVLPGGVVWTWGWNPFGQLGYGVQNGWDEPVSTPVRAVNLPAVARVSAGQLHSLAVSTSGEVWAWGYNTSGQVGDGSVLPANTGRLEPVPIGLTGVSDVSAGGIHSLALGSDGSVWAWGSNRRGEAGTGSKKDARVPARVTRVPPATSIVAAGSHSLVLADARPLLRAVATGNNRAGELGDGTLELRAAPVDVVLPGGVVQLAAGAAHSLALMADRRLRAWGSNAHGQLGVVGGDRSEPVEVSVPLDADQSVSFVAAGGEHSLAVRSDGTLWAWGDNSRGQLGDGTSTAKSAPVRVGALAGVVAAAAADAHSLALLGDGTVWAWGDNRCQQLGQPQATEQSAVPSQVLAVVDAAAVAAGGCHGVALDADGTLRAWGSNDHGQLGLGLVGGAVSHPITVPDLNDVIALSAGAVHTLVVRSDGSVWGFGDASAGQLGDGTSFLYAFPRPALGVSAADLVAAGAFHGIAAEAGAAAWAWGGGVSGQLGNGTLGDHALAFPPTVVGVRLLSAGRAHTLFGRE